MNFAGTKYLTIRYTERLAEAGAVASVGSRGDSYNNALAESFNGLHKTELIHRRAPWRNVEHVEWATLNYVDWFNNRTPDRHRLPSAYSRDRSEDEEGGDFRCQLGCG